jgi:hypothetical protein
MPEGEVAYGGEAMIVVMFRDAKMTDKVVLGFANRREARKQASDWYREGASAKDTYFDSLSVSFSKIVSFTAFGMMTRATTRFSIPNGDRDDSPCLRDHVLLHMIGPTAECLINENSAN